TLDLDTSTATFSGLTVDDIFGGLRTTAQSANSYFLRARTKSSALPFDLLPVLLVRGDGRVGVGTENPLAKLDVQGDVTVGTGFNNENHKLTIRGPNSPSDGNSYQDLSYEFTSAGSARVRAYRGSSWDTYLE